MFDDRHHISPTQQRLGVPEGECDVLNRGNLESYRALYRKWMAWYEFAPDNPNTIEGQIINMTFHDLTYRSITSVRGSISPDTKVAARSNALIYLIDTGYLANQALAVAKLVDEGSDVISVRRLLKDIKRKREVLTREIYVAGFGDPYNPDARRENVDESDPSVRIWGFEAPSLSRWLYSYDAHKRFDQLAGVSLAQRTRNDLIRPVIFDRIDNWLSIAEIKQLKTLRDNFFAHAGDALKHGRPTTMQSVRFDQLDRAQEAVIRAERAITDCLLNYRIARNVIGIPPLGIFSGLDAPYSTNEAENAMHACWDQLETQREGWKDGIWKRLTGPSQ
ncbi:MAG: hypothetical protein ACRD45_20865 [Bryobacteraceae bacterium]